MKTNQTPSRIELKSLKHRYPYQLTYRLKSFDRRRARKFGGLLDVIAKASWHRSTVCRKAARIAVLWLRWRQGFPQLLKSSRQEPRFPAFRRKTQLEPSIAWEEGAMPMTLRRFSVLRSPHVYNVSRNHFEIRTYRHYYRVYLRSRAHAEVFRAMEQYFLRENFPVNVVLRSQRSVAHRVTL